MQDKRRRGERGDVLDRAAERAIRAVLDALPPERQVPMLRHLRATLGEVLANAPAREGDVVGDMEARARLAAALRVRLPGDPE